MSNTQAPEVKQEPKTATVEAKGAIAPEKRPEDLLVSILRTKRAHGSPGDTNFRMWLHAELKRMGFSPTILAEGCISVTTDPKSDTLFSCHIDTVHSVQESDGSHQALMYDPTFDQIFLQKGQTSSCLGADDGAGIYVMLKMLTAKVPGSYIFHTGEERGGIGSRAVLAKHKDWLDNFSRAIAFDRKCDMGTSPEVIVTQGGTPCASTDFGARLVAELNKTEGWLKPWIISHGGSFTDTKTYQGVIPECINLSCFYEQAHSPSESLDVMGLELLVKAVCSIKWDDLKVVRKPVTFVPPPSKKGGNVSKQMQDMFREELYADMQGKSGKVTGFPKAPPKYKPVEPAPSIMEEISTYSAEHFEALMEDDPHMASRIMAALVMKNVGLQAQVDFFTAYLDV